MVMLSCVKADHAGGRGKVKCGNGSTCVAVEGSRSKAVCIA